MPAGSLSGPSSHEPKKRRASAGSSYPTIRDIPSPANRSTAPSGSSSWRLAPRPDAGKNILARISDQNIRARLQRDFRLLIDDPRVSGLYGLTCQGTAAAERHDPPGLAGRDRKSAGEGRRVEGRVGLGGRRRIKQKILENCK